MFGLWITPYLDCGLLHILVSNLVETGVYISNLALEVFLAEVSNMLFKTEIVSYDNAMSVI